MDKQNIQARQQQILDHVRAFCEEKLDHEYSEIAEKLIQKLGRKRNPPFATGQVPIWAASVMHAIGTNNFLFDKASNPYISVDELNAYFGTNKSSTGVKSKQIRDLLKYEMWDTEFSTKRMQQSNPAMNYVMVDGYIVKVTALPEEFQHLIRQTRAEGKEISFSTK